jgi:hypothetical protein
LRRKQAWYEAIAVQGDIQATISIHRLNPTDSGYILEGHFGKISPYGKLGPKQIERGGLLLDLLEQDVQIALLEAGWNVRPNNTVDIWEQVEQPRGQEKP